MIERFNKKNDHNKIDLLDFLVSNFDYDFYVTSNNERHYITDLKSLNLLLRNSETIYVDRRCDEICGVVLIWKSVGNGVTRRYLKINAMTSKIAKDLLTMLSWHINQHLFVKIRKDSKFLSSYKSKGFRFKGGRGVQLLLERKKRNNSFSEEVKKYE